MKHNRLRSKSLSKPENHTDGTTPTHQHTNTPTHYTNKPTTLASGLLLITMKA
jgi:hypothetical protein